MGRGATSKVEVKMVVEDADLRNKLKAQQREIKTYEKLLEKLGREGKISFGKVEKGADKAGRSIRRAGKAQSQGFGRVATSKLAGVAAGYIGLSAGVRFVADALKDVEARADAAAVRVRSMGGEVKRLIQISESAEDFQQKRELARKVARVGISEQKALSIVQTQLSLGTTPEDILDLVQAFRFEEDVEEILESVSDARALFTKELAGVSGRGITNVLLEAQQPTKLGAARLAGLTLQPGAIIQGLGGGFVETAGALGATTLGAATPEIGKTQLEAFAKSLLTDPQRRFIGGDDFRSDIKQFLALDEREQEEIIGGRKEGIIFAQRLRGGLAERIFENIDNSFKALAATGTDKSLFRQKIAVAASDPQTVIVQAFNESKSKLEMAESMFKDSRELLFDAIGQSLRAEAEDRGVGAIRLAMFAVNEKLDDITNLPPEQQIRYSGLGIDVERMLERFAPAIEALNKLEAEHAARVAGGGATTIINIGQQKNTGVLIGGGQAGAKRSQDFHQNGDTG